MKLSLYSSSLWPRVSTTPYAYKVNGKTILQKSIHKDLGITSTDSLHTIKTEVFTGHQNVQIQTPLYCHHAVVSVLEHFGILWTLQFLQSEHYKIKAYQTLGLLHHTFKTNNIQVKSNYTHPYIYSQISVALIIVLWRPQLIKQFLYH